MRKKKESLLKRVKDQRHGEENEGPSKERAPGRTPASQANKDFTIHQESKQYGRR